MKTQYYVASSINGFIADEDHSLGWLDDVGQAEGMQNHYPDFIRHTGAAAMGSGTYEWLINHEKLVDNPDRWPYDIPVWVFTNRDLPGIEGADIRFVKGEIQDVHQEMTIAAGDKNIWIVGGGDLAGQFYDAGLLDELILCIAPVMLSAGSPLLPRRIESDQLKLTDFQSFNNLYAILTYHILYH